MIVKKDGRREVFSREKVRSGLQKACQKRDISINVIDEFLDELERDLREAGEKEISSNKIGEKIMAKLHEIDDVAYVRFASPHYHHRCAKPGSTPGFPARPDCRYPDIADYRDSNSLLPAYAGR